MLPKFNFTIFVAVLFVKG